MSKILKFFDRHLAYVMIIPAIILILLFSILPILESTRYAFFDFQLNDQKKSGIYMTSNYNMPLSDETFEYIDYYLEIEAATVQKADTIQYINRMRDDIKGYQLNLKSILGSQTGVVETSRENIQVIQAINKDIKFAIDLLYSMDDVFYSEEDMQAVASELETCIIESNFIGLDNFKQILSDPRVIYTLSITLIFTFISVFCELLLGLALALIMNKAMKGRGLIRTFSLIPWAIPTSVAALMWSYLYNGSSGIVATAFSNIGLIGQPTELLLTAKAALGSIIMADVWKTTPYMALLILAGLQVIPNALYESSSLDGANKIMQFRHITLPLLKPSILVALLFRTLDAFRVFDLIWVLTGGGPGGTTESISVYAYKVMFAQTRFGYGSAMVLIMAIAVGMISYAYIKILDVKLIGE
ncbi:MAG: transporter permease [Clostridia bacterium]|jgi:multiple sugar transport system permease protein|nr:transporter permease [Clostridia bacterium]